MDYCFFHHSRFLKSVHQDQNEIIVVVQHCFMVFFHCVYFCRKESDTVEQCLLIKFIYIRKSAFIIKTAVNRNCADCMAIIHVKVIKYDGQVFDFYMRPFR